MHQFMIRIEGFTSWSVHPEVTTAWLIGSKTLHKIIPLLLNGSEVRCGRYYVRMLEPLHVSPESDIEVQPFNQP